MTEILDCKRIAKEIEEEVRNKLTELKEKVGRPPTLALISASNDAEIYIRNIANACKRVGIEIHKQEFPNSVIEKEVIDYIKVLNADKNTDAIVLHRPLPFEDKNAILSISPKKDAYGYRSIKRACMPNAVIEILKRNGFKIERKHAVIINRNPFHGLMLAHLLLKNDATVTICHSKTFDLAWHTCQADILISATGKPRLINKSMIKEGCIIVDVGMTRVDGKWLGDVDLESVKGKALAVTPVPGGVGPVAISFVLKNVVQIFENNDLNSLLSKNLHE